MLRILLFGKMDVIGINERTHPACGALVTLVIHGVDLEAFGVNIKPDIQTSPRSDGMDPDLPLVSAGEVNTRMGATKVVFIPAAPFQCDEMPVAVEFFGNGALGAAPSLLHGTMQTSHRAAFTVSRMRREKVREKRRSSPIETSDFDRWKVLAR